MVLTCLSQEHSFFSNHSQNLMYLVILLLPTLGTLFGAFFGRALGGRGTALLTTSAVAATFVLSMIGLYEVGYAGSPCSLSLGQWVFAEAFDAEWGFLFDTLTMVMLCMITGVSSLVHLYSIGYMSADPHLPRFMTYLSTFTIFMMLLVTGNNFLILFLGWEGVGLASYLLINFWFTRAQANKASIKAMIMNRVGDVGLALGIFGIYLLFKTIDYATVFSTAHLHASDSFVFLGNDVHALTAIGCLLFIGAIGKSAQVGLHTWLPDAMEGPTPVSALIHAATMVTAGVFLLARVSPLLAYAPDALMVVTLVGATTAILGAVTGLTQNDMKRVIAYSTCSQLGYMVFAAGVGAYSVALYHMVIHAFFKALLFLCAGSVIHAIGGEQDMRKMGGLAKVLPLTYTCMMIGSLALVGFPYLGAFYSKDLVLEAAYTRGMTTGLLAYFLGIFAAFCTSYYSFRLLFLVFWGSPRTQKAGLTGAHEGSWPIMLPLLILSGATIFGAETLKEAFTGFGTPFWGNALVFAGGVPNGIEGEILPLHAKLAPLIATALGCVLAYSVHLGPLKGFALNLLTLSSSFRSFYLFTNKRWFIDKVYAETFGNASLFFGYHISFKTFDKGLMEVFGPTGAQAVGNTLAPSMRLKSWTSLSHYASVLAFCLILLLLVLLGPMAGMPTLSLDADNGFLLLLAGATTLGLLI
jgi:proton-translocating NADH-quinone oxidoreductase chain L